DGRYSTGRSLDTDSDPESSGASFFRTLRTSRPFANSRHACSWSYPSYQLDVIQPRNKDDVEGAPLRIFAFHAVREVSILAVPFTRTTHYAFPRAASHFRQIEVPI